MKYLIASDIHGSAYYCRQLLEAFEREEARKMILLGDILYHGPRNDLPREYDTRETARLLNEYKNRIVCVRGNCDGEVDQMVLDFPVLAEYGVLPLEDTTVYFMHGHNYNMYECFPLREGEILLHGHTHIPAWERFAENNLYLNPGSVSIPKEDSKHGYMILEDKTFVWKDLEGQTYHSLSI